MIVIDTTTGNQVGTLGFSSDVTVDLQTEDAHLQEVVTWAIVNPVPYLMPGGQSTYVSMLDDEFAEALEEFLYKYGYVLGSVTEKHLPGRHDQKKHDPYKGRATAPAGDLPSNYEDAEAAKRYLKGVMQLEIPGAERILDVTIPNPERVKYKKKVMQDLAADTGLSEERVKELVDSWASTSNDEDPKALGLQKAAEDVLGARLTEWQEDRVADAEAGKRYSRHYYDEAREDGAKLLTAMHKRTQEEFAGLDKVTLYRGVQGDQVDALESGKTYDVKFNSLESWSLDSKTAKYFAEYDMEQLGHKHKGHGVVMRTTVPIERIVATPKTGFGCLAEFEMLVHGLPTGETDEVEIVWSSEDIPF